MTQKYYAVTGTINSGIYENLRDAQKQTMNTRNGEYRVFDMLEEARDYLIWSEEHEGAEYVRNKPVEKVPVTDRGKKDKLPIGVMGFKYAQKERKPKCSKRKCEENKLIKQNKANEEANAKRYDEIKKSQVNKPYCIHRKHVKRNRFKKSKSHAEGKKFYAIAVGYSTGVFYDTWDRVRVLVEGCSGARYKGFKTEEQAIEYLADHGVVVNPTYKSTPLFTDKEIEDLAKGEDKVAPIGVTSRKPGTSHKSSKSSSKPSKKEIANYPQIYSDGSYDKTTGFYGYSTIVLIEGEEPYIRYGKGKAGKDNGWQVNGEVAGAMFGIDYVLKQGFKDMVINYDLVNIERWGNAEWKANKSYSIRYRDYVLAKRAEGNHIHFNKVKAHSGNKYNEWADFYAKKGLGITKYDNLDAM